MAKLTLQSFQGAQPGSVYEYSEGVVRIGRDPDNDIVFADSSNVSRKHAEIKSVDGRWEVVDLKSANGTLLNRQRISDSPLRHGDELQFGSEGPRLRVTLEGGGGETILECDTPVGEPTHSELFPLHMGLEPIKGKGFLVPGVIAALGLFAIVIIASMGNISLALTVSQLLFAGATVGLIYCYCGKTKPIWVFVGAGLIIGVIMAGLHSEIKRPLQSLTESILGEQYVKSEKQPETLPGRFIYMLLLAAVPEELEKIVPAMLGLWLFFRIRSQRRIGPLHNDLAVREPLDGILLGVAAAAGFSVIEGVINPLAHLDTELTKIFTVEIAKAVKAAGLAKLPTDWLVTMPVTLSPLELLNLLKAAAGKGVIAFADALSRGLGDIAGHQAFSGIFGYYVGLAALYPAWKIKLILRGFVTAVLLHAAWNTAGLLARSPYFSATDVVAPIAIYGALIFCFLAMLIACILQARKISPTRATNFATNLEPAK